MREPNILIGPPKNRVLTIMINRTVMVIYHNKNFVATNYSSNIFCCNKLFLIIIKIFYWNEIFVAIVYCQRLYRNSGQRIFFVAIEVYCNNLNLIAIKKFVAIRERKIEKYFIFFKKH